MNIKKRLMAMNVVAIPLSFFAGLIFLGYALFSDQEAIISRLYLVISGIVLLWSSRYIKKLKKRVDKEL